MTDDATPKNTPLGQLVVQRKNEIQALESDLKKMLPPSVPSDKFVRTVQTAVTLNPDLAQADKNSVLNACMKAAADGLVLDGREAALTIYNVKQKDGSWKKSAQYIPMVAGIIKRVRNSGEVSRLNAFVVHANDVFHVAYGLEMTLKHEPNFADAGKPLGAYAVCLFKDGQTDFEFMSLQQIEAVRGRSKSGDNGPWKTDWSEMARKTVIRRLSKRLPVDSDIARVVEHIDEDYDFKPAGRAETPMVDEDGVVIEQPEAEKAPAKTRGAAAAKLNTKFAAKAAEVEEAVVEQGSSNDGPPADHDEGFEDLI